AKSTPAIEKTMVGSVCGILVLTNNFPRIVDSIGVGTYAAGEINVGKNASNVQETDAGTAVVLVTPAVESSMFVKLPPVSKNPCAPSNTWSASGEFRSCAPTIWPE